MSRIAVITDTLLNAVTATGAGKIAYPDMRKRSYQAKLANTTTPTATVKIYGANISGDTVGVLLGTITLSGALDSDGFTTDAPWTHTWANCTAISGTSAAATCVMGA